MLGAVSLLVIAPHFAARQMFSRLICTGAIRNYSVHWNYFVTAMRQDFSNLIILYSNLI